MADLLIVVAAALIDADGRVLIAERPDNAESGGLWEFPGGKLEAGESPEEGLVRELREELAIDVSAACLAPSAFASERRAAFHLLMPLFVCRKWRGAPKPMAAKRLAWVRPREALKYNLASADRPLAAQLGDAL
ncbi:MAG: (deoxy)nucleoside triphosphate pyrophosphohydrolase [Parvularculaceae bacterium]